MEVVSTLACYVVATNTPVKGSIVQAPGACTIKLITAVVYGFRNKLECLPLTTRLGWKGLPGTNAKANYGNRKLRP